MASASEIADKRITWHILKTALALCLTGFVGWLLTLFVPLVPDLKTATVGLLIVGAYIVVALTRNTYLAFSRDMGVRFMADRTGIVEVYPTLEACKAQMQADFRSALRVRMLLQIGRREFGNGGDSYFAEACKAKSEAGTSVRILRASPESPFLSEARAAVRQTDMRRWQEDMRRLENELNLLRDVHGVRIEHRPHREPFLWRMFLFDDTAYISAYLHQRDNDRLAPVYRLKKGSTSIFPAFDRYFEYLWAKSDPTDLDAAVAKWAVAN